MTDHSPCAGAPGRVRLDRWLWAARFFRTRALAKAAIEGGKVLILPPGADTRTPESAERVGSRPKPGREIGPGERLLVRQGDQDRLVVVRAVDERRGSATIAARLFEETLESLEAREADRARRQLERAGLRVPAARPDKRDRRERRRLKVGDGAAPDSPPDTNHASEAP